ncbi:MAG TPA: FKBP-type peptidyl-prolyl cis-trans isomerase [Woeseiaceae bacterium]|nr:FKBP-type peptidyl-prolyl cis-trans isomerase [Woeseiaceae bacterium]
MIKAIFSSALLLLLLAACEQSSAPVEGTAATDAEGVEVRVIKNGYGRAAEAGDVLTVHTTGWLYDEAIADHRGEKFWSSLDSGDKLTFTLGAGQMIQGWDRGLPGMLIGEVRELTIPPELGYGAAGRGPIPANATLVFEVELFNAVGPEQAPGQ